ncbi:DUF3098 domain-containing protein [Halalkalibaculum sp. DA3122]|uniref:DUF3098 domain-containing protein n=1 Tax=unclassified Halalkalibaculum TaxID=2964617 RepID=UPI0037551A97
MVAKQRTRSGSDEMFFSSWNYKTLVIGFLLVVVGFTAMYLENEVQGFISLYVSPIVIMAGYITVIFAIMKHDKSKPDSSE